MNHLEIPNERTLLKMKAKKLFQSLSRCRTLELILMWKVLFEGSIGVTS